MFQCRKILAALVFALALPACGQPSASSQASASGTSQQQAEGPEGEKPQVDLAQMAAKLHTGIDVSHHSGAIDWKQVAAQGHGFAIAKATEGVDLKDSAFDAHWQEIKAAGLLRGAYHFYVTEDPPYDQASFFIENVQLEPGDLAPIVDIELIGHDTTLEGLPQRLKTFVELLEGHYGIKPIIYTSPNFWDKYFADINFGDYPLWIAEYGVDAPRIPQGWSDWHLWQFQGDVAVTGIEKDVDLTQANRAGVDHSALIVR